MSQSIRLRNVSVHNLQSIDLDLPKRKLIGFCGPSGSGKSSVAIDTIFAEGQRRYLDTFSMAERGLFDQPEKPDADEIEGVPPAVAITRSNEPVSDRVTVGSMTELSYLFQNMLSRFGRLVCPSCNVNLEEHHPESIARFVRQNLDDQPVTIGFDWNPLQSRHSQVSNLVGQGFVRAIKDHKTIRLETLVGNSTGATTAGMPVLVDRIRVSPDVHTRLTESIELAFREGNESCFVLWQQIGDQSDRKDIELDGQKYSIQRFGSIAACNECGTRYRRLSAHELSFNSHYGACELCEGLGKESRFLVDRIVVNENLSLSAGAIAFLNDPQWSDFKKAMESGFEDWIDIPWKQLNSPEHQTTLNSMLDCLEECYESIDSRKNQRLLEPVRGYVSCRSCLGSRLNKNALAHQLENLHLGQLNELSILQLRHWVEEGPVDRQLNEDQFLRAEIRARLDYLHRVGLDYLSLGREVNSLSTGERQRVSMTNALGSKLVNMLYIFDEPSAGLHPTDVASLIFALKSLTDQGNTVLAVDHELSLISELDHVTEFGPGSGMYGGQVIYSGTSSGLKDHPGSVTGEFMSGRSKPGLEKEPRAAPRGNLKLENATGHNLKNVSVTFPLGVLCVVTGVSGSGKSSLVIDTLYPAIKTHFDGESSMQTGLAYDSISGVEALDDVILIDQAPLGSTTRSNPATYCKAFDAIRSVFAETVEARARNIKAGRFSFNTEGGRCDACKGEGTKQIDMKFMANLRIQCKFCKGLRYKKEILNCRYRGQSIADVLEMTVREAFAFFRGKKKVQSRLKPMIDVGLDYLRLGQPSATLSSGESQRLRLAGFLSAGRKARTLFVLDEPTVGLHYCDVQKLLDCFDALLAEGHSVILVEHNTMVMSAAHHLIDLGPGAGGQGGEVVATGSPVTVANNSRSKTGQVLRELLD